MAEPQITPEEEALRRRARRRLVGSLALALLAIVVLPMVFEPEPKPLGDDVEIVIPGQDTPFKPSAVTDNRPAAAPAANPPAISTPVEPTPVELAPVPARPPAPAQAAPAVKPQDAKLQSAAKAALADKPAKPAVVAEKTESKSAAKPVAPEAKPAAKPAAPEAKPTGKPSVPEIKPATPAGAKAEVKPADKPPAKAEPAATAGSHFLQLGSFGAEANAKQLADKIKAAGYPVKVIAGQGAFKVRVGPYAHRDTAAQALGELKAKGFAPVMVTP